MAMEWKIAGTATMFCSSSLRYFSVGDISDSFLLPTISSPIKQPASFLACATSPFLVVVKHQHHQQATSTGQQDSSIIHADCSLLLIHYVLLTYVAERWSSEAHD